MNKTKRILSALLGGVLMLSLLAGCKSDGDTSSGNGGSSDPNRTAIAVTEQEAFTDVTIGDMTCTINTQTGMITQVKNSSQTVDLDGFLIDVGYGRDMVMGQVGYQSYESYDTWKLPVLLVKRRDVAEYTLDAIYQTADGLEVNIKTDTLTITYDYTFMDDELKLTARLSTSSDEQELVNGVAFMVRGIDMNRETSTFEYPGSTPASIYSFSEIDPYRVTATDYSSPVVCLSQSDPDYNLNVLFLDEEEKWSTSAYSDENSRLGVVNLAAVEGYLKKGEEMVVGDLYLQLLGDKDKYTSVQDFYADLGYAAPENAVSDGPMYEGFPYGTMDTDYQNPHTLQEYAEYLDDLQAMGIKNVWLLPIFINTNDNVYEPIDQSIIDPKYGGNEGAKVYIDRAHELGMRVLFDYVPHGPRPDQPLAVDNPDWISKNRDGENQIEWECVSFDYNNPGYFQYTVDLVKNQALEVGVDGARIDCSMGGLSNWSPQEGLRASSSGLRGGQNIVKAITQGFEEAGKDPMIMPENFHPVPFYASITDVFYDMPLFRMMYNLNQSGATETEYAQELMRWLDVENKTSVKGQVKLRFLGNHDTVTWTFDAARPQVVYGTEKAKALWCVMSFIDGIPFLYQGDEDPATYGLQGENLVSFFTDIFGAREEFLPEDYTTEYIASNTPVFACTRSGEDDQKLVLVNLSNGEQTFDIGEGDNSVLFENGVTVSGTTATLAPYSAAIIQK